MAKRPMGRMRQKLVLTRRSARRGRRIRRRIGLIRPPDRALARALLRHFRPFRAPMPLIRVGPQEDGGYLVPDDLEGIVAAFSPGVSDVTGFDEAIAARGIVCFLADASVTGPENPPEGVHFEGLFLGGETGGQAISLDDWVAARAPEAGDLLLQMDIEGAEYEVLNAVSEAVLGRFRIIVIEFHGLWRAFTPEGRADLAPVLEKLARQFRVVHVHGNNNAPPVRAGGMRFAPVLEVTYLRRDRAGVRMVEAELPHPLDRPNDSAFLDVVVPRVWDG
ncbi:MAG: FkbM family methyltransferase [Pseudopelagicola sp.]|nr:FkbM family methyltransferase [Pseudopelagicola sp.]